MENKYYLKRKVTIYVIKKDDKIMYVGCTVKSLKSRTTDHFYSSKKGSSLPVHKWLRENIDTAKFEIIATSYILKYGHEIEQDLIKLFKTHISEGGLNSTYGGVGVRMPRSQEFRENMRIKKNQYYKNNHGPNLGKKFSDQTRKNMSLSRKNCRKVLCVETNVTYRSLCEAARELGLLKTSIAKVCYGQVKKLYGKTYKYV